MATRTVHACDFCKAEVECDQIPLSGSVDFDVCKACFEAKGLGPLVEKAREAKRQSGDATRQSYWQQAAAHRQAAAQAAAQFNGPGTQW